MRLKWIVLILAVLIADLAWAHDFVSEPVRKRVIETTELNDRGRSFVRARDFRNTWTPWELNEALDVLFGSTVAASESRGKVYYSNDASPFQVVEDPFGHYFRVRRKADSVFVDRNGEVPSNADFAKTAEMTHFRYMPPAGEMTFERFFAERAEARRRLLEVESRFSVIAKDAHFDVLKELGADRARTELLSNLFGHRFATGAQAWEFIGKLDWTKVPDFFKYEILEIGQLGFSRNIVKITDQNRAELAAMARWGAKTGELRFVVIAIEKLSSDPIHPLIMAWYERTWLTRMSKVTRSPPTDAELKTWERIRATARTRSAPTCRGLFR